MFLVELAQDDDHQRLVELIALAAVAEIRNDLEDTMIVVVQQRKASHREQCGKDIPVAMDKVIVFLVGLVALVEERLS